MFRYERAYSGFAAPDLQAVKSFYSDVLGVPVSEEMDGYILRLDLGDREAIIYAKPDHQPSNATILNFEVADIAAAVDQLTASGVTFERYDGWDQDEKGIMRGNGPDIAWFHDPAGNQLAVLSA